MRINLDVDDGDVLDALNRLRRAGGETAPALRSIGEDLINSTRERFNDHQAPDGSPWADLKDSTKARKPRNKDKILTRDGDLRREISYRLGPDHVDVGSSRIYAGTHQFGADRGSYGNAANGQPIPWGDIPARPFLGVSDDDRDMIEEVFVDHLRQALLRSVG